MRLASNSLRSLYFGCAALFGVVVTGCADHSISGDQAPAPTNPAILETTTPSTSATVATPAPAPTPTPAQTPTPTAGACGAQQVSVDASSFGFTYSPQASAGFVLAPGAFHGAPVKLLHIDLTNFGAPLAGMCSTLSHDHELLQAADVVINQPVNQSTPKLGTYSIGSDATASVTVYNGRRTANNWYPSVISAPGTSRGTVTLTGYDSESHTLCGTIDAADTSGRRFQGSFSAREVTCAN